jgi:chorismate synthase
MMIRAIVGGIALGCVLGGFTIGLALIITDIKKQLKKK